MEIRLNIDDDFIGNLVKQTGSKPTEIARDGISVFSWIVGEIAAGRVVLSSNQAGQDVHRLVMASLQQVERKTAARQAENATAKTASVE
ncbi:hypothetical protein MJ904_23570 [Massilia sp. MB5]|uniref:hypothetical protein n=1 Tax=unclassified Massilia TaxID=2609279 RepID=UPI00067BE0E2|nr:MULTISPECIES: hypothetical protein [unclassified Massilia]AKU20568.1 hypothetical protein ACZ75_02585 [Massilia sp. NR 4-1]UMR29974.1 hypothetical protein MJ904_23570 [Massilia sp. MB5]